MHVNKNRWSSTGSICSVDLVQQSAAGQNILPGEQYCHSSVCVSFQICSLYMSHMIRQAGKADSEQCIAPCCTLHPAVKNTVLSIQHQKHHGHSGHHDATDFCSCRLLATRSCPGMSGTAKQHFWVTVWSKNAFHGGLLCSVALWPMTHMLRL